MKKRKIMTIFIIISVLFGTISMTLGKYIYNSVWSYYLTSREFYFESDMLDINTKKNSMLKWDGEDIKFKLKNGKNDELISEYDITYKIVCEVLGEESDYIDCDLNNTNKNVYDGTLSTESYCVNSIDSVDVSALEKTECEINGYVWHNEVTTKLNFFNLKLTDDSKNIDEVSIKITVESLSPYKKELIGIFNLNKLEEPETDLLIEYQGYDEYDELILTNLSDQKKCVEINFLSDNYVVDIDDTIIDYSLEETNKIILEIPKEDSIIKDFYKTNFEKKYSIEDFVIVEKDC